MYLHKVVTKINFFGKECDIDIFLNVHSMHHDKLYSLLICVIKRRTSSASVR